MALPKPYPPTLITYSDWDTVVDAIETLLGSGAVGPISLPGATKIQLFDTNEYIYSNGVNVIFGAGGADVAYVAPGGIMPSTPNVKNLGGGSNEWGDLFLGDGAIIYFGSDQEVTLTHVPDTGLRLNSNMQLQFRDSAILLYSNGDGALTVSVDASAGVFNLNAIAVANADFVVSSTLSIKTAVADDSYFTFEAKDTGNTRVEVGRVAGGTDPYVSFGGNQEYKFRNSGFALFGANVMMNINKQLQFRDNAIYIYSSQDGYMDLVADTRIEFTVGTQIGYVDTTSLMLADNKILRTGNNDGDLFIIKARDTGVGLVEVGRVVGAGDPYIGFGGTTKYKIYYSDYMMIEENYRLYFRDSAISIRSAADTQLDLNADGLVTANTPQLRVYSASTDAILKVISEPGDAYLHIDSGNDGTPEASYLLFADNASSKWGLVKTATNTLWLYDYTQSEEIFIFTTGTPTTVTVFQDTKLQFRDSNILIQSDQDGRLRIEADASVLIGPLQLFGENVTTESGGTSVNLTSTVHFLTTNGDQDVDILNVANGVDGQTLKFVLVAKGHANDSVEITPTNLVGGSKVVLDVEGSGFEMVFDGTSVKWCVVSYNDGVAL